MHEATKRQRLISGYEAMTHGRYLQYHMTEVPTDEQLTESEGTRTASLCRLVWQWM